MAESHGLSDKLSRAFLKPAADKEWQGGGCSIVTTPRMNWKFSKWRLTRMAAQKKKAVTRSLLLLEHLLHPWEDLDKGPKLLVAWRSFQTSKKSSPWSNLMSDPHHPMVSPNVWAKLRRVLIKFKPWRPQGLGNKKPKDCDFNWF